jgi:hypothetical protein
MPSIQHESPIEIIRRHPEVSAELVRRTTKVPIPDEDEVTVTLAATDASNVVPAQFTADIVTLIRDKDTGKPAVLVVVEPQGRSEEEKRYSWPAYLANLREAHQCDSAILVVLCWSEPEAEKCRQAIRWATPDSSSSPSS